MRFALLLLLPVWGGCENRSIGNPNTTLTPATHSKFPIASGDHAVDCNNCHGEFNTFAQFDCLNGCHAQSDTDPNHANVPGYMYTSAGCYSCHPDGMGVDHSLFFPIGPGTKHNLQCSSCHTDPNNHMVFSCINGGCHSQRETDSNHSDVQGYVYDSNSCYGCHFRGKK